MERLHQKDIQGLLDKLPTGGGDQGRCARYLRNATEKSGAMHVDLWPPRHGQDQSI